MPYYTIGYEILGETLSTVVRFGERLIHKTPKELESTLFHSERELNHKELSDLVNQATKNALVHAINHRDEYFWSLEEGGISFAELYFKVVEELENLGLKELDVKLELNYQGSASICTDKDGESEFTTPENKLLIESIPKELREEAIKIARDFHKEYFEGMKEK